MLHVSKSPFKMKYFSHDSKGISFPRSDYFSYYMFSCIFGFLPSCLYSLGRVPVYRACYAFGYIICLWECRLRVSNLIQLHLHLSERKLNHFQYYQLRWRRGVESKIQGVVILP